MKCKTRTIHNIALVAAGVVARLFMGAECLAGEAVAPAIPKTATIIPAPREMRVTGGEYWAKKPPKMEKVDGIPPAAPQPPAGVFAFVTPTPPGGESCGHVCRRE